MGAAILTERFTMRRLATTVVAMGAFLALPALVSAASLTIDDLTEAFITIKHDANWEFSVISNGVV